MQDKQNINLYLCVLHPLDQRPVNLGGKFTSVAVHACHSSLEMLGQDHQDFEVSLACIQRPCLNKYIKIKKLKQTPPN